LNGCIIMRDLRCICSAALKKKLLIFCLQVTECYVGPCRQHVHGRRTLMTDYVCMLFSHRWRT
jgi:hypothetical protein